MAQKIERKKEYIKMPISFVKNDKIQLTQSIKPNVIHNRYDLLYGNDYDLLKIEEENSVSYI